MITLAVERNCGWQIAKILKYSEILNTATIEKIVASRYKYSADEELEKLNHINAKFYTEDDEEYPEKLKVYSRCTFGYICKRKCSS